MALGSIALATARIFVEPDMRKFGPQAQAGIQKSGVEQQGKRAGRNWGNLFAKAAAAATAATGAIYLGKRLIDAATESNKVAAQTSAVLKSTGGAAKVTATQVSELANALAAKTGIDDEAIQSGQNMLLTFRGIRNEAGKGNDIFNQATGVLTDMTAALNGGNVTSDNLRKQAIQLGKALNDPVKGMTALRRVGVSFTDQQTKQITKLQESGHTLEAQKIILRELNKEFKGSAEAAATPTKKFQVALGNLEEVLGNLLIPVLNTIIGPLTKIAMFFLKLPGPVQKTVIALMLAVGAFIALRKAATAFTTAMKIASISNPWLLLATVIITVVALIITHWDKVKKVTGVVWHFVLRIVKGVWGWIKANWPLLLAILTGPIGLAVRWIIQHWQTIRRVTVSVWNAIRGFFTGWWNQITARFRSAVGNVRAFLGAAWHAIFAVVRAVWGGISGFFTGWWSRLKNTIGNALGWIRRTMSSVWHGIKDTAVTVWTAMKNAIGRVWGGIKTVAAKPINWILNNVWNPFASLVNKVLGFFHMSFRLPTHAAGGFAAPGGLPSAGDLRAAGFARGGGVGSAGRGPLFSGYVTGPGGPRSDRVGPVMVSNREYVLQASATSKYGKPLLDAMNAGRLQLGGLPGFQLGGIIGGAINIGRHILGGIAGIGGKLLQGMVGPVVTPIVHGLESGVRAAMPEGGWGELLGKIAMKPLDAFLAWVGKQDAKFGSGPAIVREAMKWVGRVPYVWGGTAVPGGADCSGFVTNMYNRFGISPPRTSEAQYSWVKRTGPVPGGLAFYRSAGGGPPPGHVAIVKDANTVISQGGGMGPQIERLKFMPFMGTGIPPHGFGPGGAGGGTVRENQLAQLWISAGGPKNIAHLMAAIAMAESGGRASAYGPFTPFGRAEGLWQILGKPFPGNALNPLINARMAVAKWRSQGLSAWEAYTNGSYRRFMAGGGRITEPVLGIGQRTGAGYVFGESGEETVVPGRFTTRGVEDRVDALTAVVADLPTMIGAAVADALDGVSRRSGYRTAYSAR